MYNVRVISSVGRAPALQAGGHWFEPGITHFINIGISVLMKHNIFI